VATVELRQLRRVFGEVVALDGIDVEIASGEFLSLLGPSGCGKTTALRLIAGFDRPTSGSVVVGGHDVTGVPPNKRGMGMVFQAYSLFPNMTAERNVEFGLKVRRQAGTARRERVAELLDLVGLGHAGGRYPHQLSGGMQQRVALARALAIEPSVLLLDEPLSALDAKVRVQLREEIRRIQTRLGITTIYVTHDQEEALSISDRVAVMSQGRIEQIAPPAVIYGAPATPFVAEFVGTMNRVDARVGDPARGSVEVNGSELAVDAARGRPRGDHVLLLVRPETVEVSADAGGEGVEGEVLSQTFLGSHTRLHVAAAGVEWTADLSAERAAGLPVGARVRMRFPSSAARLLTLDREGEAARSLAADPDDR
jgi:putative spermidine/putrescine transport system ATP-binding protein